MVEVCVYTHTHFLVLQGPCVTIFPVDSLAIEGTINILWSALAGKVSMDSLALNSSSDIPWCALIVVCASWVTIITTQLGNSSLWCHCDLASATWVSGVC